MKNKRKEIKVKRIIIIIIIIIILILILNNKNNNNEFNTNYNNNNNNENDNKKETGIKRIEIREHCVSIMSTKNVNIIKIRNSGVSPSCVWLNAIYLRLTPRVRF